MLRAQLMCNTSSAGRSVMTSSALYDGYHHSRHLSLHPFGVPGLRGPGVLCLCRRYGIVVDIQVLVGKAWSSAWLSGPNPAVNSRVVQFLRCTTQDTSAPRNKLSSYPAPRAYNHAPVSALLLLMKPFDLVFWIFRIRPQGRQTRSNALAPPVRLTTRLTTADFELQS